jgi:hypothetical protein
VKIIGYVLIMTLFGNLRWNLFPLQKYELTILETYPFSHKDRSYSEKCKEPHCSKIIDVWETVFRLKFLGASSKFKTVKWQT